MIRIKFSARYRKMPEHFDNTMLLAVFRVDRSQLSSPFVEWDTEYADRSGHFQLSSGSKFLVLLLLTENQLWTTIRAAWPPEKEEYYRSHIGEHVEIELSSST
jgi:hypothetical protein